MKCDGFDNGNFTCLVGKKILIAGGTGFIGKRCVQVFEKLGCQLTVITRRAQMMDEKVNYIKVDLRDVDGLRKCLDSEEFDHAVYLAANIPLAGSAKETYLEAKCSTFDPFVNFCEVVLSKVKSFIYISSIDVIGACEKEDYTETEEINRPTPYGLAKYVGEFYVKTMCETLNVPYKILRFSQVYGANEPAVRIIPIIKNALFTGNEFNLFTHGDEKRRFLFIDDAVQAIVRSCIVQESGIYNIAGKDSVTILELIAIMEEVFESKLRLNLLNRMQGLSNQPSIKKAETSLGFIPNFTLEQGLQRIKAEEKDGLI